MIDWFPNENSKKMSRSLRADKNRVKKYFSNSAKLESEKKIDRCGKKLNRQFK